jgi:hypothetical protein
VLSEAHRRAALPWHRTVRVAGRELSPACSARHPPSLLSQRPRRLASSPPRHLQWCCAASCHSPRRTLSCSPLPQPSRHCSRQEQVPPPCSQGAARAQTRRTGPKHRRPPPFEGERPPSPAPPPTPPSPPRPTSSGWAAAASTRTKTAGEVCLHLRPQSLASSSEIALAARASARWRHAVGLACAAAATHPASKPARAAGRVPATARRAGWALGATAARRARRGSAAPHRPATRRARRAPRCRPRRAAFTAGGQRQ